MPQLKEQSVYDISNFKIVPGPSTYRSVDMDMAINFFYKTTIQEAEDNNSIPHYKFELQPFHRVKDLVGRVKNLIGKTQNQVIPHLTRSAKIIQLFPLQIDVIGMVTTIGRLEKRSNGVEKLDVALTDDRNEKIIVTLWEERAYQFQADKASLSSTDATKTFFNIEYEPLNDLKKSLSDSSGSNGARLLPPATVHFVATDEKDVQQIHIKDVLEMKIPSGKDQVRCLCTATITEILYGNGWLYNCCSICARAVHPTEGKYYCNACNDTNFTVSQRYRVVARIKDDTGTTTVTLFNKEAEQLIGVPIQKIITEMGEPSHMDKIPAPVANLIGKLCAFQIKINNYNITHGCEEYTVTRVSECSAAGTKSPNTVDAAQKNKKNRLE
nr:PREDICTED: replication protein A 70 kDa DNA-binding subunit D-like [Daucus carota subsp. sativus]